MLGGGIERLDIQHFEDLDENPRTINSHMFKIRCAP